MLLGTWILYSFILAASYGGSLRAFLMRPVFQKSMDTMEKVIASGLTWEMGLYGEPVENEMATSEDPTIKRIWDDKIPVMNEPFAFKRVKELSLFTQLNHIKQI